MKLRALLICLILAVSGAALALSPEEVLDNPVLEQRARDISGGLRCLVCQNQSIDDSDADLAKDLRLLVRERLVAGDTNAEVEQYLVDRYGEYVLLNPRLSSNTILLWIAAPVLLLVGLIAIVAASRRRTALPANHIAATDDLSAEEKAALERLEKRSGTGA